MSITTLDLAHDGTVASIAKLVATSRRLIGWSQRELATRAHTAQASVSRLESGRAASIDVILVARVLGALGLDASLVIRALHLEDRRRQRDGVHARVNGCSARRYERWGWRTATEVGVGDGAPRGWIDLLAYRPVDRALLIQETKTDIPDMGGLQRSLAFYQHEARAAARRLDWDARKAMVLVVALDSVAIATRLADNRDLVHRAFPARVGDVAAWLKDPAAEMPRGWAIATCDPASREANWLRPTMLGSRRRPPAYRDYAHAAAMLLRS
jgi:transcriptional regulator with XRE-family HTH domain